MRKIDKISFKEFKKDIEDNEILYDKFRMPSCKTQYAAEYVFKM